MHEGGDLASVTTVALQDLLLDLEPKDDFWIGLNDENIEGLFTWADGAAQGEYSNWLTAPVQQPNAASPHQDYVKVRGGAGGWDDVSEGALLKYACQIPIEDDADYDVAPAYGLGSQIKFPGLTCEDGWLQHLDTCYTVRQNPKSWDKARKSCKVVGGDLAAVTNIGQ